MRYIRRMGWTVEVVSAAESEMEALPMVLRAPHVGHLDGKLWELRVRGEGGAARGIYVAATERRVVVLHVFAKKSRKTPRRALATARERMRQVRT